MLCFLFFYLPVRKIIVEGGSEYIKLHVQKPLCVCGVEERERERENFKPTQVNSFFFLNNKCFIDATEHHSKPMNHLLENILIPYITVLSIYCRI
jgi:hypothetical protein